MAPHKQKSALSNKNMLHRIKNKCHIKKANHVTTNEYT